MEITLNELRKIVKKIIKEEEEKTPKEILGSEYKIFKGNYKNFVLNKNAFVEFLNSTDPKNLSNVRGLIKNTFNSFNELSRKYTELFDEFVAIAKGPFLNVVELLKTRLPEMLKTTIEAAESLKKLYQYSDNEELDKGIKDLQYGIISFMMAIERIIKILPSVEASLPPKNSTPQQQSNVSQSNTNSQQVTDNLKTSNNKLQERFFEFEKAYKSNKNKYLNDGISKKRFSTVISDYLNWINETVSKMENEISKPINENSFKITIFEHSDSNSVGDNFIFDEYVTSLKKYVVSINETVNDKNAISIGKINAIIESIGGIMRILKAFKENLNTFSR